MPRSKNKTKILLTGGHAATTALATIEEIIRRKKDSWDIHWIGSKRAMEGKDALTLEAKIFPEKGVTFYPIIAGRIQRKFTVWTIPSLFKIPVGILHAFYLLFKIKPKVILSFGGFAAFPVSLTGFFMGIPVIIHEQTSRVGRANKFSAPFARKVALARSSSAEYFSPKKTEVIGNPIMTQILDVPFKDKKGDPPTLFVTGGSRGSRAINEKVEKILPQLLEDFVVVHQTGEIDYDKFKKVKSSLKKGLKDKYEVYDVIDPMQIDGVYRRADIVIARAGANTVSEIIATKRPAILIPIPWSYLDEQRKNARFAENFGVARIFEQESPSEGLLRLIKKTDEEWEDIVKSVRTKKIPDKEASSRLVDMLEDVL